MEKLSFGSHCMYIKSKNCQSRYLPHHSVKVIAICIFFILAVIISSGGIGPGPIGFKYWKNPGAFADSINGVARTFVIAGTLYAGTEMFVLLLNLKISK